MSATKSAAPAQLDATLDATETTKPAKKAKKSKKHQISRSPEARKARRIIRQSLRYAIMAEAEDIEQEERDYYAEWLVENEELIDESLEYMASIRREPKPRKAEKSETPAPKKARKPKKAKIEEPEELDEDDAEEMDEDDDAE